ncbi:RHS repeat-associated core domain-containing protein [Gilliamella sp. Pas-s25]|uniref:RHS repeat-associated core domain-containing protein n=1 Tax=Gilliamella sp. Pas-s25 TaxID=2687310 RepID=UPI00301CFC38
MLCLWLIGLNYNLNRYYDPFTGRYITQDPLGILGGLNSYQYAGSDPINWVDPLGLVNTASKANEKLLEKTKSIAIESSVPDIYSDLAIQATKNGEFDQIMLGKYNEKGI